jgi:hypothetical protein
MSTGNPALHAYSKMQEIRSQQDPGLVPSGFFASPFGVIKLYRP